MKLKTLTFSLLALIAASAGLSAQNLPKLKAASEVSAGELPNGVSYYFVTNRESSGFADYALVQKDFCDTVATRKAMNDLPHFGKRKIQDFLSDNNIAYDPHGLAEYSGQSTVLRFRNVPVSIQATADSTLLMLLDLALSSPYKEAIVVSGDINPASLKERMQTLSMLLTKRVSPPKSQGYEWKSSPDMDFRCTTTAPGGPATIEFDYRMPRTPVNLMGTVQQLVSRMFAMEISNIVKRRAEQYFRMAGIPLGTVDCTYVNSDMGPGDEHLTIRLTTSPKKIPEALTTMSEILSDLDKGNVEAHEFKDAKAFCISEFDKFGTRQLSNGEWTDKCIAAFLYGSSLAPSESETAFFKGKRIDDDHEFVLFRDYISGILDSRENLKLSIWSPVFNNSEEELKNICLKGWSIAAPKPAMPIADTLILSPAGKKRAKIKTSIKEPLTGGQLWTMSNGMKVVYKKSSSNGHFDFALMVKGGFGQINGLNNAESRHLGDMLFSGTIAGIDGMKFKNMLKTNGIVLDCQASHSDLRITGTAPSSKLQLLFKSLVAICGTRQGDPDAFKWYRKCEEQRSGALMHSREGIFNHLDSLVRGEKDKGPFRIDESFMREADAYYGHQFNNLGNAMLVFYGDLGEEELRRQISKYVPEFSSGTQRPLRTRSGISNLKQWSSLYCKKENSVYGDGNPGVNLSISASSTLDAGSGSVLKLAGLALERELVRNISSLGCSAFVETRIESFPNDRISMRISCSPCDVNGLPDGMRTAGYMEMLAAVRKSINKLCVDDISAAELKTCQKLLTNATADGLKYSETIVDAVLRRNSEGKDEISGYKERIAAVTAPKIREMMMRMQDSTLEYIVY